MDIGPSKREKLHHHPSRDVAFGEIRAASCQACLVSAAARQELCCFARGRTVLPGAVPFARSHAVLSRCLPGIVLICQELCRFAGSRTTRAAETTASTFSYRSLLGPCSNGRLA